MNTPAPNVHVCLTRMACVAIAATFVQPAFSASSTTGPSVSSSTDEKRAGTVVSGSSLESTVRRKLEEQLPVAAPGIVVERKDGDITLSGKVRIYPNRDRAQEIAEGVRGVTTVINRIEVDPITQRSDAEIKESVQSSLAADGGTAGLGIRVTVAEGEVTLKGDVQTEPQRRVAGWLSSRIPGVTGLNNELVVRPSPRKDADIQQELTRHFETSALFDDDDIHVKVHDGVVQLRGSVDAANEKTWAQMDAWVAGVKQVDATDLKVSFAPAPLRSAGAGPEISDSDIREAIHQLYTFDPRIDSFKPDISVSEGVVTLSGFVSTPKAKQAAVQIARHMGGVVDVVDRLEVRSPEPRDDEAIAESLRAKLRGNSVIEAADISIDVKQGRVTLRGRADDAFEKWTAGDIAERTFGVISVANKIEVVNEPPIFAREGYFYPTANSLQPWFPTPPTRERPTDDAELMRNVRSQLSLNPFTDDTQIEVVAENGIVTLRGEVDSSLEQRAAATTAFQAGAKDVISQLRISNQRLSSTETSRSKPTASE